MKEVILILMAFKGEIDANFLKRELEDFYHVKVKIVKEASINSIAFDKRTNRFSAGEILDYQLNYYKDQTTIAVTSKDIAINKFRKDGGSDWGVAGLSLVDKHVSVMSLYRTKNNNQRASKILLHEFGHGLGLPHCNSKHGCLMKNANGKLSTIDKQPKKLCNHCTFLLKSSNHENISTYRRILRYLLGIIPSF